MMRLTLLVVLVVGFPFYAEVDRQTARHLAIRELDISAQAEVLADDCGYRLNRGLWAVLRNHATSNLKEEELADIEQFARAYALALLHRHHEQICEHALEKFGREGEQIQGLLLRRGP